MVLPNRMPWKSAVEKPQPSSNLGSPSVSVQKKQWTFDIVKICDNSARAEARGNSCHFLIVSLLYFHLSSCFVIEFYVIGT